MLFSGLLLLFYFLLLGCVMRIKGGDSQVAVEC